MFAAYGTENIVPTACLSIVALHMDTTLRLPSSDPSVMLQIHSTRQLALGIVHSFPRYFGNNLLDALAEQHGAPALQSLMSLCIPELVEVTWDDVKTYLHSITPHTLQNHIPFLKASMPY